jgi:hypothetical protein
MNALTTRAKRDVLASYARQHLPQAPASSTAPDFIWEQQETIARRELGELLRPFADRPQDIPDAVVDRAWSLYLLAGGAQAGLFQIPDLGASPLALVETFERPRRSVTVGSITFSPDEIATLLAAASTGPSAAVYGAKLDLSDPLAFHEAMKTEPKKYVFDAGAQHEVWNTTGKLSEPQPFRGERPSSGVRGPVGNGELVEYTVTPEWAPPHAGAGYEAPQWKYWLEVGASGEPVNGGWIAQPDFLWTQDTTTYFDRDLALRIYQESIAPTGTGQIGEPSWWGLGTQWAALTSGLPFDRFTGARFDAVPEVRVERPSLEQQIGIVVRGLKDAARSDARLFGMEDYSLEISTAGRPEKDGFAGPAGDGELQKLEFSWREPSGEPVRGALWVESKDGRIVNGDWIGEVPRQLQLESWVLR